MLFNMVPEIPCNGALNDSVLRFEYPGGDISLSHFSPAQHLGKQEAYQLTRTLPRDIFPKIELPP